MLQLFFKTSGISPTDWAIAYARIESIVTHFPLKLFRAERYIRRSPHLDTDHLELRQNIGTLDESLAFCGDWVSYTAGCTVRFYKNWEKYVEKQLSEEIIEPNKPLTWHPHKPFRNNGIYPKANGAATKPFETEGAFYEYALLAIGMMLENLLPNQVFLLVTKPKMENMLPVQDWLEGHFKENFNLPLCFDKKWLLNTLKSEYENLSQVVNRLECLCAKQYKRNMEFALEKIGYAPTLDCYAQILSHNRFGTFGFSDVLDPWIAVTQDLETVLELVAASKQYAIQNESPEAVAKYDLTYLLKQFLKQFILWTPAQRALLSHFYTNEPALETGEESLKGMIYRMTGNRVNICPMYATEQSLFEAFMYHDPKNGTVFKQIIEEWVSKNVHSFEELQETITTIPVLNPEQFEEQSDENSEEDSQDIDIQSFVNQYPNHEQALIHSALSYNPIYAALDAGIQKLRQQLHQFSIAPEHQNHIQTLQSNSIIENIDFMKYRLKEEIQGSVHPLFEAWLNQETNKNVIFYLTLLLSLKLYDPQEAYIRYRLLWDKTYWDFWRN